MRARREIEKMLGHRCHLELFVKVEEDWRDKEHLLDQLGVGKRGYARMDQFNKIPSLVQIFIAEFFGVLFLSVPISKIYERIHPPSGYQSLPLSKGDYIFVILGA